MTFYHSYHINWSSISSHVSLVHLLEHFLYLQMIRRILSPPAEAAIVFQGPSWYCFPHVIEYYQDFHHPRTRQYFQLPGHH